jgi:hypothetical protein
MCSKTSPDYFVGTAFDRVRVEMRLVRLSTADGKHPADFFFSSMIAYGLHLDLDGGALNVPVDEFDLNENIGRHDARLSARTTDELVTCSS